MEFHDLSDAAALMGEIAALLPEDEPRREDFAFFASISCTTRSEYREETKSFLEEFIVRSEILRMPGAVRARYPQLVRLYGWL